MAQNYIMPDRPTPMMDLTSSMLTNQNLPKDSHLDVKIKTEIETHESTPYSGSTIFQYNRLRNSFKHDGIKSYQDFYFDLRFARYATLLKKDSGVKFKGVVIETDEKVSPTINCEIVMDWLEGIDERLPELIEQKYALELQSVTLYDLQTEISENIHNHLLDIDKAKKEFKGKTDVVGVECKVEVDGDENRKIKKEKKFKKEKKVKKEKNASKRKRVKGGGEYKCEFCEAMFKGAFKLEMHRRIHTGEKPFSCEDCGQSFSQKGGLTTHRLIHTGEKMHMCDDCGKSFIKASKLRIHQRVHTGEKPFPCDECDKTFRVKSMLKVHKRKHTGIPEYICDVCCKGYYDVTSLTKHVRTHLPPEERDEPTEATFGCDECGKFFTKKAYLAKHKKGHSGIRNHPCDYCGKAFSSRNNLIDHIRTHTGEKPFVCDVCNKGFSKQNNLKVHKRIHTGEAPFICRICGLGTRELIQLKKHMINMHRVEYSPSFRARPEYTPSNENTVDYSPSNGNGMAYSPSNGY